MKFQKILGPLCKTVSPYGKEGTPSSHLISLDAFRRLVPHPSKLLGTPAMTCNTSQNANVLSKSDVQCEIITEILGTCATSCVGIFITWTWTRSFNVSCREWVSQYGRSLTSQIMSKTRLSRQIWEYTKTPETNAKTKNLVTVEKRAKHAYKQELSCCWDDHVMLHTSHFFTFEWETLFNALFLRNLWEYCCTS